MTGTAANAAEVQIVEARMTGPSANAADMQIVETGAADTNTLSPLEPDSEKT
jgi:hypothetical protein